MDHVRMRVRDLRTPHIRQNQLNTELQLLQLRSTRVDHVVSGLTLRG